MRKRLFSMLLAVMLVVSILGVVPAHAAKTPELFHTAKDAMQAGESVSDGASVMSADAFRYLANACKTKGERDGSSWVAGGTTPIQDTNLELGFTIEYDTSRDEIYLYSWIINNGQADPITAIMRLTNAAEAPFEEILIDDNSNQKIGGTYITCDFDANSYIYFTEYYGASADSNTFVQYNTILCTAMTAFLHGALTTGGYTAEDIGLVAAARNFGVNNQTPFNDVRTKEYYYKPVLWAIRKNITNGTSATRFSPNDTCTRAQVVTFLWRSAGSPAPKSTRNPFVDVDVNQWYGKAVLWAVEKGITNGVDNSHFAPNQGCTRGQVVTFLQRSVNGKPSSTRNPFRDVSAGAYYYNAVLWAVEKGITNGVDATHFGPDNTCTRGQIVTFLYRAAGQPAV